MSKFYLNNYKWIDPLISILLAAGFFILYDHLESVKQVSITNKLFSANNSLFGALASLLGFVFATVTILIGLGDNFNSNNYSNKLIDIIDSLRSDGKKAISSDDEKLIQNKHSASSLFFSTTAFGATLNSLFGCVIILATVFLLSLLVDIIGIENKCWTSFIIFYLILASLTIIRLLLITRFLIKILTNKERSNK